MDFMETESKIGVPRVQEWEEKGVLQWVWSFASGGRESSGNGWWRWLHDKGNILKATVHLRMVMMVNVTFGLFCHSWNHAHIRTLLSDPRSEMPAGWCRALPCRSQVHRATFCHTGCGRIGQMQTRTWSPDGSVPAPCALEFVISSSGRYSLPTCCQGRTGESGSP